MDLDNGLAALCSVPGAGSREALHRILGEQRFSETVFVVGEGEIEHRAQEPHHKVRIGLAAADNAVSCKHLAGGRRTDLADQSLGEFGPLFGTWFRRRLDSAFHGAKNDCAPSVAQSNGKTRGCEAPASIRKFLKIP